MLRRAAAPWYPEPEGLCGRVGAMLKDVLDRVATQLPRYFGQLCDVLARPVAEVHRRARAEDGLDQAVIFWSISLIFYLTTRYVAYYSDVDEVRYFVGNLIASCVTLVVVSLAIWWVWHLFGAGASLASHVAATAYVWGALMPIQAVLHAIAIGTTRLMSDEVYAWLRETTAGCFGERTPDFGAMAARAFETETGLPAFGVYSGIVLVSTTIDLVYCVAYLRVLRSFRPISGARFVLVSVLSCFAALVSGLVGTSFYLVLAEGVMGCR